MVGTRVVHPYLGSGTVIDTRFKGMQWCVRFDNSGMELWVNREVLKILKVPEKETKHKLFPIQVKPIKRGDFASRKLIEAFRMGIVPYFGIEDFTFGRDRELQKIKTEFSKFEQQHGGVLVIEGDYGSGKTHLLDYLWAWSFRQGYAVAKVELDPWDVTPSRPKHVYREIVRSLVVNKDNQLWNFRDILHKVADLKLQKYHIFFSRAAEILRQQHIPPAFWDWIEGEYLGRNYLNFCGYWKLPVLLDHAPAIDLYCYLLSGLGHILHKLDVKGFIILLDEVETLFHLFWYREQEFGCWFYHGLIKLAMNDPKLLRLNFNNKEPPSFLGLGKLDELGFIHSGVRPLPYIYELPTNIFLVIAITPSMSSYYRRLKSYISESNNNIIQLSKLSVNDVKLMTNRLIELYQNAFTPFRLTEDAKRELTHRLLSLDDYGVRQLIRTGVETMDLYRHYS